MFAGERPHVPMVLKLFTKVFYCFKHFNRNSFTRRRKKKHFFQLNLRNDMCLHFTHLLNKLLIKL